LVQGRRFPRRLQGAGGKGSALQMGERSGSCAWGRASRPMCDGHSPKILLISRSQKRRNQTRRPLLSLGYARLKPNRSASNGFTRRFSPSARQEYGQEKFLMKRGRIPRDTKSPPSVVLR
jgi:hypothetical protein